MSGLFSKTYLVEPAGKTDSKRFRARVAARAQQVTQTAPNAVRRFADWVRAECGCAFPRRSPGTYDVEAFFLNADLRDVLDGVTIFSTVMREYRGPQGERSWIEFAARVMREEGLAYEVGDDGAV